MFEKLKKYIKDNPKGYWFKKKIYGWGWFPVKWQGWFVIIIFALLMIWVSLGINDSSSNQEIIWFFVKLFLIVAGLIFVCYKTGEKPRWQWGLKDKQ